MRKAKLHIAIGVGCAEGTYMYTVFGPGTVGRAHTYCVVSANAPTETSVTIWQTSAGRCSQPK